MSEKEIKSELEEFRAEKDEFFKTDRQSPLTREQKREFHGLNYFPENPDLRFEAELEVFPEQQKIAMQTSTGDSAEYTRYARFHFVVDGQTVALTVYTDEEGGYFLPFADSQAGKETYGAGRYLEPDPLPNGRIYVDFNLAYNPYCAYNENWSCPLTPFENRLKVPIRAGEKSFHPEEV
jgi:uncharacterized protein (DUF1684 family)